MNTKKQFDFDKVFTINSTGGTTKNFQNSFIYGMALFEGTVPTYKTLLETFCTTHVKQYRNAKHVLSRFLVMTGTEMIIIVLALQYCLTCVVQKVSIGTLNK